MTHTARLAPEGHGIKATLDALVHSGVYIDDSQIDRLIVCRDEIIKGGQCPKSITGYPSMFRRSANPMTGEEVLGILGQVQHREPLGAAVLDAQIAQDKNARAKCVGTLQAYLASNGVMDSLAFALAEVATAEVCDSPACKKCQGTGSVLCKEQSKFIECPRCNGVGRYIPSQRELHQMVCHLMPGESVTRYEFNKKWYDVYMSCVDQLHRAASQAGQCARQLLDSKDVEN